ncbi:MAG: penicillin-binding protein 2 [Spirochaetaceae bacterium]|jgi:penicillin-binding protein 2|nr:penicillin-binding protein 2 [Spirochaetaceae bacterium]
MITIHDNGDKKPKKRIKILQIIFITIFFIYAGRLFAMQIIRGDIYRERADDITRRRSVIPAERGEIYTRDFTTPLVYNINSFAVRISPAEIKRDEIPLVLERLAHLLNIPLEQIERKLPPQYHNLYQPLEIASNIPYNTIALLAERVDRLPGVSWQSKPVRDYHETGSLAHVIGYVGDITRDELTTLYNKKYQQGDLIGKAGIEKQYDEILRGKDGAETSVVDVQGKLDEEKDVFRKSPESGKNLVLTIDKNIQILAEKALGERIGSVVVLRPTSGEILALVSYPWYDPDIFTRNDSGSEYQNLINNPKKPLINRAIQSHYPPGSAFKIVMTTGILAENVFSPDKKIDCPGEISYGDRLWRCHIRKPGHGALGLRSALAQSCDIYYWVVGRDYLGVENIINYAHDYGLGELTGIDIPGEIAGFIPTPQWKDRKYHEKWVAGDTMNISIGQGFTLVTPLQMANMVAMVVNDGVIYKPHLLKEIRDPLSGAVEEEAQRKVLHTSEIDKEIFEQVRSDMRAVISEGTARFPLNIKSVEIAGKTGTSEIGLADRWHSWFAAFAPYQTSNPDERIVVSIIVEAANNWEWWSPYASSIIYQGIFAHQSYEEAVAALNLQYLMTPNRRD